MDKILPYISFIVKYPVALINACSYHLQTTFCVEFQVNINAQFLSEHVAYVF